MVTSARFLSQSPSGLRIPPLWQRGDRVALLILCAHVLIWTLQGALMTGELYPDTIEALYWGREWLLNTPKHPPFSAWLIESVVALSGSTHVAVMALAALVTGGIFAFVWLMVRLESDEWTALAALIPLPFMHFFNVLSLKYNADTVLALWWVASLFFFRRALVTDTLKNWILLGIVAAFAFLTKYPAVLLFASALLFLLLTSHRRLFFTKGPWVTALVAFVLAAPNLYVFLLRDHGAILHLGLYTNNISHLKIIGSIPEFFGIMLLALLPAFILHFLAWRHAHPYAPLQDLWRTSPSSLATPPSPDLAPDLDFYVRFLVIAPISLTLLACFWMKMRVGQGWATPLAVIAPIFLALRRPELAKWLAQNSFTLRFVKPALIGGGIILALHPAFMLAARWTTGVAPFIGYDGARLSDIAGRYWAQYGAGRLEFVAAVSYVSMDQLAAGSVALRHPDRPAFVHADYAAITPWATPEQLRIRGALVLAVAPRALQTPVLGTCVQHWHKIDYPTMWNWYVPKPVYMGVIAPNSAPHTTCPLAEIQAF